ncbi:dTMP kinase [Microgenomates bacterium UTCPR1]|nr:MAG: dTMP kinase [Microgenomates bacterium UTCPR1]
MFVVIEGIDGAGCETQGKNIISRLQESGEKTSLIKYPNYERNVGKLIKEFLYQNKDLTAEQQFLLYTMQFVMDARMIAKKRKNEVVIADRYFTTTLCYQTLEGVDMKIALDYAKNFKIEVPDAVFYLNVDPDIAIKRKFGEDKEKNRREKDFEFIRKTQKKYGELVKNQVWSKWIDIDGNKGIEEITEDIYNKLLNLKKEVNLL